jgi:hypothetical protein
MQVKLFYSILFSPYIISERTRGGRNYDTFEPKILKTLRYSFQFCKNLVNFKENTKTFHADLF